MADNNTEKQRVQELTNKLEQGLQDLFNSDSYRNYLSTMSKFHNYSFNNTLLIAMQKPDATLVAGYKAWQKNFERHVNKGEKAIRILAPAPYKIKEERDKIDPVTQELLLDKDGNPQKEEVEITIPAFRAVSVFDLSQTDGKPIPELTAKELLSDVEGYQDMIRAVEAISPVPIELEEIAGDSKGYYDREAKRIAVQENMSESQTLKTMIHEVAHSKLHSKEVEQDEQMRKDRNTKEVEAESVAYTVYYVTTLHAYEPVILKNALIYSDNIYFAKAALKIGERDMESSLTKLGFNEELPFDIKVAKSQFSNTDKIEKEIQLADSGYGQGQILVNPLHMACMYSAFCNEGNMIKPYLTYKEDAMPDVWIKEAFTKDVAQTVLEDTKEVINNSHGTGYAAHRTDIILAGKTGTAEIKASKDDTTGTELGWFSVFTTDKNMERPIMIVSMVEDVKGRGGSGYVVKKDSQVLEKWLSDN